MKSLLPCLLLSGILNAAGFMVEDNTAVALGALVATVATTIAVVSWVDKKIDAKLVPLSKQIEELRKLILRNGG